MVSAPRSVTVEEYISDDDHSRISSLSLTSSDVDDDAEGADNNESEGPESYFGAWDPQKKENSKRFNSADSVPGRRDVAEAYASNKDLLGELSNDQAVTRLDHDSHARYPHFPSIIGYPPHVPLPMYSGPTHIRTPQEPFAPVSYSGYGPSNSAAFRPSTKHAGHRPQAASSDPLGPGHQANPSTSGPPRPFTKVVPPTSGPVHGKHFQSTTSQPIRAHPLPGMPMYPFAGYPSQPHFPNHYLPNFPRTTHHAGYPSVRLHENRDVANGRRREGSDRDLQSDSVPVQTGYTQRESNRIMRDMRRELDDQREVARLASQTLKECQAALQEVKEQQKSFRVAEQLAMRRKEEEERKESFRRELLAAKEKVRANADTRATEHANTSTRELERKLWEAEQAYTRVKDEVKVLEEVVASKRTNDTNAYIKLIDPIMRVFVLPWTCGKTWVKISEVISQILSALDTSNLTRMDSSMPLVYGRHWTLTGPNGDTILPPLWEKTVQPGWLIRLDFVQFDDSHANLDATDTTRAQKDNKVKSAPSTLHAEGKYSRQTQPPDLSSLGSQSFGSLSQSSASDPVYRSPGATHSNESSLSRHPSAPAIPQKLSIARDYDELTIDASSLDNLTTAAFSLERRKSQTEHHSVPVSEVEKVRTITDNDDSGSEDRGVKETRSDPDLRPAKRSEIGKASHKTVEPAQNEKRDHKPRQHVSWKKHILTTAAKLHLRNPVGKGKSSLQA